MKNLLLTCCGLLTIPGVWVDHQNPESSQAEQIRRSVQLVHEFIQGLGQERHFILPMDVQP